MLSSLSIYDIRDNDGVRKFNERMLVMRVFFKVTTDRRRRRPFVTREIFISVSYWFSIKGWEIQWQNWQNQKKKEKRKEGKIPFHFFH